MVAAGLTSLEIAAKPHLSESMVKTHVSRAMAKIGARDRMPAVIIADDVGLVDPRGCPARLDPGYQTHRVADLPDRPQRVRREVGQRRVAVDRHQQIGFGEHAAQHVH